MSEIKEVENELKFLLKGRVSFLRDKCFELLRIKKELNLFRNKISSEEEHIAKAIEYADKCEIEILTVLKQIQNYLNLEFPDS